MTGVDEFTPNGNGFFDGEDNTKYWESEYGNCKRTSYNTRAGVHIKGGIPFRKNFAAKGYIYDPVRDAFYTESPYSYWTLNEDTCIWEPPASWIQDENGNWTPPVEKPEMEEGEQYVWDEENVTWKKI